jgi:uncharacterized membrane protein HdeD (DUF308 family)
MYPGEVVIMDEPVVAEPPAPNKRGCFTVVLGIVVVLVGIPMLICPGPGTAVVATGVGMIVLGLKRSTEG